MLVVSGPSHHDIAALTNAKGRFRMGGLEPGKYRIEVIADGYLPVRGSVRVLAEGTRLYRIALEAIDLDDDGASVPELD